MLSIKSVHIVGRSGENLAPSSGNATFSDNKMFGWSVVDGEICLFTRRRQSWGPALHVGTHSPKRSAILKDWLKNQ